MSAFLPQQTLPVDLSNSSIRSGGNGGASFHGSNSAFDPCCPGSTSRPPAYVPQATPGPSQPAVVDSFSSSMVAQPQPQTQPQPCRHYLQPPCKYPTYMQSWNPVLLKFFFFFQFRFPSSPAAFGNFTNLQHYTSNKNWQTAAHLKANANSN